MNQTVLSGNLTADIENRDVGEQHLSLFTLACNEGERVVFMPIEAWNMPHLAEHLFKGSKALISGSLKQDHWENEAGEKRSRILLTAYKVEFLDAAPKQESRNRPGATGANRATGAEHRAGSKSGSHASNRTNGPRRHAA